MIKPPTKMRIYPPTSHFKFDTTAEPTIEDAGATNYATGALIADGAQVINAMDGHPDRFLQVGTDLLTGDDSTFASDTGNWTKGTGVTISAGKLNFGGAGGDAEITLVLGTGDYEVIFTISGRTAGTMVAVVGGTAGSVRSTNATFTQTITGGGTTTFTFSADATFDGSIDNATVRLKDKYRIDLEANSRQSYNSLVLDGNNLLTALPASMRRNLQAFYHTADTFGSATEITPSAVFSGLLGQNQTEIDFDGLEDSVTVTDDASITDIFDGGGALEAWVYVRSDGGGNAGRIFNKGGWILSTVSESGGFVKLKWDFTFSGTNGAWTTDDAVLELDAWHLIHLSYNSDDVANNPTFSIDSVDVANTESSTPTGTRTTDTGNLFIGNNAASGGIRGFDGKMRDNTLYNRTLSTAEKLARTNGGEISVADQWGNQTALITGDDSDFDTIGNWIANGAATVTGGFDSGDTGFDKTMRVEAGDASAEGSRLDAQFTLVSGKKYIIAFDYKDINADSVTDHTVRLAGGANLDLSTFANSIGAWTHYSAEFTATAAHTTLIIFIGLTSGDAANEQLIDNVSLVQVGAVGEWSEDGISSDQSKWFDNSDNLNTGAISGAEIFNGPDSDNLGYILYEFTAVSLINLFWFFQQNQDADTALANVKDGWLPLCEYNDYEVTTKGYGGVYAFPGSKTVETESGDTNSEKFFGRKPSWTIKFAPLNDADFFNLQAVLDATEGKLLPFYARFAADSLDSDVEQDRIVWRLRVADNGLQWTYNREAPGQPWDVTLRVVADIN